MIQSPKSFTATLTVPAGTAARVCLPAPHAAPAGVATALTLDGVAALAEPTGRMLCFIDDVGLGKHVMVRVVQ